MAEQPFSQIREIASLGRDELERRSKQHVKSSYLGEHLLLCKILTKYKVYLDTRDVGVTPNMLMDGYWESWITQFIAQTVQPGDICIDAGANFGYYSLLLAELSGKEGKTIAVEPNSYLCKLLSFSNSLNGFHFNIINKALAGHTGEMTLFIPRNFWGSASIRSDKPDNDAIQERVQVDTLDNIVTQSGLPRVDFIKMDCEGAEPEIFAGMEKTVQQNPQIKMVMEYSPFAYENAQQFTEYLFSKFEVGEITGDARVRRYAESDIPYLVNLNDHIDLFLQVRRQYIPTIKSTGGSVDESKEIVIAEEAKDESTGKEIQETEKRNHNGW